MMNDMFSVCLIILGIVLIAYAIVFIPHTSEVKKLRKQYDAIHVGDVYIQNLNESNPYYTTWGSKVEIIDKRLNNEGVPYVKYRVLTCSNTTYCCTLEEFLNVRHYEPYIGQDEEGIKKKHEE